MSNVRWESPYNHTIPYVLFKKHFTEINQTYWAFVPAENTIIKFAKDNARNNSDPKSFFLIHDEDDRRVASTYDEWKCNYSDFSNYTRINYVMMLSSCLETYLRTVISLSFESKPGVIIRCPDSIDGAKLLIKDIRYGKYKDKNYQFSNYIDDICVGTWDKRMSQFEIYFGELPNELKKMIPQLDEFRILRNDIAHYFSRTKRDYEVPLQFEAQPATRIAHNRITKFFALVHDFASGLDKFLKEKIIGSYDVIKFFYQNYASGEIDVAEGSDLSIAMRKFLSKYDYVVKTKKYYRELVDYCCFPERSNVSMFQKQKALHRLKQIISESDASITSWVNEKQFKNYITRNRCKNDRTLCVINMASYQNNEYLYSEKLLQEMASYFINRYTSRS